MTFLTKPFIKWNHTVFVILCLIFISTMFLRFIHVVACARVAFLFSWQNNIPLDGNEHPLVDEDLVIFRI